MSEKEMEKDPVILYEQKANNVRIDPQAGRGRKLLKNFSWIAGGELMRRHLKSKFAKTIDAMGIETNDIKDLTDRWRKHVSITLTKNNLIFNWKQGYGFKVNKTAVLFLVYMTSVYKKRVAVCVDFELPSEDESDPIRFTLQILFSKFRWGEKQETWMTELSRIKAQS